MSEVDAMRHIQVMLDSISKLEARVKSLESDFEPCGPNQKVVTFEEWSSACRWGGPEGGNQCLHMMNAGKLAGGPACCESSCPTWMVV